jgi:ribonucleoside-diphosphate reductase alpha chain
MKKSGTGSQLNFDVLEDGKKEQTDMANADTTTETVIKIDDKLKIPRYFTTIGKHPYDEMEWNSVTATITNDKGEVIFLREGVEVPKSWSQNAINIVASKYFHTFKKQETSVKQMIDRVARTVAGWGNQGGYFATQDDYHSFEAELTYLLVNQMASFNSPVWFNVGVETHPQCSACFINSVEDTMDSILDLAKIEGLLFKWGSGTGTNLSTLRSSKERLTTGGFASGPVSFMRGYDAFAGVIKSGGKTRRAAKMVILNADHPDIVEFINCKANEEKKAWALIDAGYDGSFGGEAYGSVFFQNSNNSIRATDDFMRAVEKNLNWQSKAVTSGEVMETYHARDLMKQISSAAHICGDPGIQFHTTINEWHTCSNSAPIVASNPCSEYMFVDNSACNLASLNLLKFVEPSGEFKIEAFRRAVHILIIAQEILVDNSSYPTERITMNSRKFRPLGLGYANLGALLMFYGLPYDSPQGRATAATITALLTGQAYLSSAIVASSMGTFDEFDKNREPMLKVMAKHNQTLAKIENQYVSEKLFGTATEVWNDTIEMGGRYGFRNAQVTVLAPTGTIGFMMDCDTTGIEPDIALVKYKKLSGGGDVKLVNNTVGDALKRLKYTDLQIKEILQYIETNDTIEGAPHIQSEEHLKVFDCAFKAKNGKRFIGPMGHVQMMAAVQPFLSGAISKTVNLPTETTPENISDIYMQAWKLGLKSIAIYRDASKRTQPLNTSQDKKSTAGKRIGVRRKLPDERHAMTHKFSIVGHEGYITVGEYDDGTPGEIFIVMAKEGSVVSGLMDSFATAVSIGLQYGVPLKIFVNKFIHTRFEPYGFTNNKEIPIAKSISDYIFRWLGMKYLKGDERPAKIIDTSDMTEIEQQNITKQAQEQSTKATFVKESDAPLCPNCGTFMVRSGACHKCINCGDTSGCS